MSGVKKKGSISEEDISLLLQRYTATTILALLQEVSQFAGVKIDWNALVKKTSTGISSAREYQMLWRHLAYRDLLLEKLEDEAETLDDDSDLEFELEAVPAAGVEASSEAAACVKILISSGSQSDSGPTNRSTVEAPLTINIPNGQISRVPLDKPQLARSSRGMNITVPVSVQKQPLPTGSSAEGVDANGSAGSAPPAKKKRKLWTKEEDLELIAAVQKCGEGNWANILKGDFHHSRSSSQLSQRWSIIRKRQASSNPGGGKNSSNSLLSEAQLAARKAVFMALNMPTTGSLSAICSGVTQPCTPSSSPAIAATPSEASPASAPQAVNQFQQASSQATTQKGTSIPPNKSRATAKKTLAPVIPSVCPSSLIQAAAFAAGARIATPSTAASLFKAAQSKNAVHIRHGGSAVPKSPSNLRITQPAVKPPPPVSGTTPNGPRPGSQQVQSSSGKLASRLPPTSCATPSNLSTEQALAEIKPGSALCGSSHESPERKSENAVSGTDVSVLPTEEGRGDEDEIKLDGTKEQDHLIALRSLDVGENSDNVVDDADNSKTVLGEQTDLSNPEFSENQIMDNEADTLNAEAAENQAMVNDAVETQIPVEDVEMVNVEAGERQNVDNVSGQRQYVAEEQLDFLDGVANEANEDPTLTEQQIVSQNTGSDS